MSVKIVFGAALALTVVSTSVAAQTIGPFVWQTQPYCNRVVLTVVQHGGVYQLLGTDDQCGMGSAPVTGTGVPTGSGVAMGLTIALSSGRSAHLSTTVSLSNLSGTWTDAEGRTGPFVFAGSAAGEVRPAPAGAAGRVVAMGFVNASGATPVLQELRTAPGVTLSVTSPVAGRVDVQVVGADTADAPIVLVTPHSTGAFARTCNSRALISNSATSYTARIECYDAAGVAAGNTSFQVVVID